MTTSIPSEKVNSAARRDCVQSPMGSWCFVKAPGRGQLVLRGRTSVLVSAAEGDIRKRRVENLVDSRGKTIQQG